MEKKRKENEIDNRAEHLVPYRQAAHASYISEQTIQTQMSRTYCIVHM